MKHKKKTENVQYCLFGFPINKENIIVFLFVLAVIVAVCIVLDSIVIVKDNFLVRCSAGFLVLCAFSYLLKQGQDKSDKDYENAQHKK